MPTAFGQETINERLTRLRVELARARETIARSETNGASFSIGGHSVSQLAYESAVRRERTLSKEIAALEARLLGAPSPGVATIQSRGPDAT